MLFSEAFNEVLSLAAGAVVWAGAEGLAAAGLVAGGGVVWVCITGGLVAELSLVLLPVWLAQPAASSNTAAPAKTIFFMVGFFNYLLLLINYTLYFKCFDE
jgi:hypothetical protein